MKNISVIKASVLAVLTGLLLVGCNNDELEKNSIEKPCDYICFVSSDKGVKKNGAAREYTANRFVLRSKNSKDTLCVRTIVSDGINIDNGKRRATRGVPVTTGSFYNKFHVLAYMNQNGTNRFFMNQDATNGGDGVWRTNTIYYWPGSEYNFDFYAWAPVDAQGLTTPANADTKNLVYTVPDAAADQKDIVVADCKDVPGDKNTQLGLDFKHICTAVRFVVGSDMQPGTIKSVSLKGVKYSGTYDMAKNQSAAIADNGWTLNNVVKGFTQTLNKATAGSEADGSEITTAEGTFMMLPQTLPDGATVEVVFNGAKGERTLTASIGGMNWEKGKTYTYKLSISPDYDFEIEVPDEIDAHYLIVPVKVTTKEVFSGNCYIKAADETMCKFRMKLLGPEERGYWPKENTGTTSDGTTPNGISGYFARETQISLDGGFNYNGSVYPGSTDMYAFITENAATTDRNIKLEIWYNGKKVKTKTVKQHCPNWVNGIGWEHIEEIIGTYKNGTFEEGTQSRPFGYAWDRDVTYKTTSASYNTFGNHIQNVWFADNPGVILAGSGDGRTCRINYNNLNSLTNAFSPTNGLANCQAFNDGSALYMFSLEWIFTQYLNIGDPTSSAGNTLDLVRNFAGVVCLKKNACDVEIFSSGGHYIFLPRFKDDEIKWYLPAIDQFDASVGLEGEYWSSTAIDDGTNAYSWNGSMIVTDRMSLHKVRAVRKALP